MYVYQYKTLGKYSIYKLNGANSINHEPSLELDLAPWYSDSEFTIERAATAIEALQWFIDHISADDLCEHYKI